MNLKNSLNITIERAREENNMEREQIIKALGMCTASRPKCKECPYFIGDIRCKHSKLLKDALALINEMTEENRKRVCQANCDAAEIKILREHWMVLGTTIDKQENELKTIKADTVWKMQERLKRECLIDSGYEVLQIGTIDQIAKEMLEEK
jgi:hypothetical protein